MIMEVKTLKKANIDLPNEIWLDVIGYDGYYEISNYGRIKSLSRLVVGKNGSEYLRKENIKSLTIDKKNKRLLVCFSVNGINKSFRLNQQVALHFLQNYDFEYIVFKDDNYLNCSVENIIVITEKNVVEHFSNTKCKTPSKVALLLFNIGKRRCYKCQKIKNISVFSISKRKQQTGLECICRECKNIESKVYYYEK